MFGLRCLGCWPLHTLLRCFRLGRSVAPGTATASPAPRPRLARILSVRSVQIESQEGLIELPVEQLLNPTGADTNMNGWTQKMRDTFHAMGGRAREASKLAYSKASESYSRVASAVRPQGAQRSCLLCCTGAVVWILRNVGKISIDRASTHFFADK